jgi:DNA polymerase elongation subunit (family B)
LFSINTKTSLQYFSKDYYKNVLVFEEINRLSREALIKTKDIVQKLGYELIYADTDSVFIKTNTGTKTIDKYSQVVAALHREIGLPISIEQDFKFLILLPLEASEKIEALKQYYGITHEGELVVRGIESRRHDTPKLIKQFQIELLYTLFNCKDTEEVVNKGYENALLLVTKAIDKIMIGGDDITQDDLVISLILIICQPKYPSRKIDPFNGSIDGCCKTGLCKCYLIHMYVSPHMFLLYNYVNSSFTSFSRITTKEIVE